MTAGEGDAARQDETDELLLEMLARELMHALPHSAGCVAHGGTCLCATARAKRAVIMAVAVLPSVKKVMADAEQRGRDRAADETERLADERVWTTEHDNEVVSVRDLYEHVARLRGELEPVTYDFPPSDGDDR